MARYIAFDWGARRTGVAVTDSNAIIATPLETVDTTQLNQVVTALVKEETCAGLVVGVPGLMIGSTTNSTDGIYNFIRHLEKTFPELAIHKIDEGSSSSEAMSALISGGMKKRNRSKKGALDKVAAAIILQRFLDSKY
ncbi:MAG TPA: Holliday junction resolvase RuvX [Flavobacteriales bacterium]|jgi:putative Holliday junction resolvase|nr:Holliday junction resolvase RuvX [Flavobacteriales bacterium]HIN41906.1 Holliday junction resolvase RuvX [Flavobacteriales bacterium]HIO59798.1 Holliday junction resolvase RuvX [Flavobacteriales bacterium]